MVRNVLNLKNHRLIITLILGFSSGLPLALSGSTLQAWLTVSGLSLQAIGFVGLAATPYTLKFLWAPLMDRWSPPFLGRRRGWIAICQVLLCLCMLWMAFLDPKTHPPVLFWIAAAIAFLSASQDIAIDAYRTDILQTDERPMGAAMAINGYRIAMLVSGGLALVIADHVGWQNMYFVMIFLMGIGLLATLLGPNPEEQTVIAAPRTLWDCTILPIVDFLKRPHAVWILLFIVFYKLGDAFAGALTQTFLLRAIKMSLSEVGSLVKLLGFLGTIIGTTMGAWYVPKLGWFKALLIFGILQALSNLSYLVLLYTGPDYVIAGSSIFFENLCGGMGSAAFTGLLMGLCNARFTAFQYALFSSLSAVGRVFIGPIAGIIAQYGWFEYFMASLVFAVPGLLLLCLFKNTIEKMTATHK
ncbi:MAG: MFS transporter [Gammaproteobacteria bacterium]|nr:MFS transporter [Gammaproteobacteria bacterium]MBP9728809.1 MFS transporter [Gammaproteobacteria bacterium]